MVLPQLRQVAVIEVAATTIGEDVLVKTFTLDVESVGQSLKHIRQYHQKTLAHVALKTGLSVSYLSDIERGVSEPPLRTLHKLAAAYGFEFILSFKANHVPDDVVGVRKDDLRGIQQLIGELMDEESHNGTT